MVPHKQEGARRRPLLGTGAVRSALRTAGVAIGAGELAKIAEIDRVLKDGAERAAEIADPVVDEVKKIVGFWRG